MKQETFSTGHVDFTARCFSITLKHIFKSGLVQNPSEEDGYGVTVETPQAGCVPLTGVSRRAHSMQCALGQS
jgi:hypothetical protein